MIWGVGYTFRQKKLDIYIYIYILSDVFQRDGSKADLLRRFQRCLFPRLTSTTKSLSCFQRCLFPRCSTMKPLRCFQLFYFHVFLRQRLFSSGVLLRQGRYVCMCVYICIYMYRERENIYIYIYTHIYIYIQRER